MTGSSILEGKWNKALIIFRKLTRYNNGFVRSTCEDALQPGFQDAIQKCDAMKAMPEELKAGVFDQFNISIEEICRVSLDFLDS